MSETFWKFIVAPLVLAVFVYSLIYGNAPDSNIKRIEPDKISEPAPTPEKIIIKDELTQIKSAPKPLAEKIELKVDSQELVQTILSDNICMVHKKIIDMNEFWNPQTMDAINQIATLPESLKELLSVKGPFFSLENETKPFQQNASLFVLALQYSGHITSPLPKGFKQDDKKAHKILLELEKKDPGNAAYPLLRLGIEKNLSYPKEKLQETAAKLLQTNRFQSYFADINSAFIENSWDSPSKFLFFSAMRSSIPYHYLSQSLQALGELEANLADPIYQKLSRILQESILRNTEQPASWETTVIEFGLGNQFNRKLGEQTINIYDLVINKNASWINYTFGSNASFDHENASRQCERSAYDAEFYQIRARY